MCLHISTVFSQGPMRRGPDSVLLTSFMELLPSPLRCPSVLSKWIRLDLLWCLRKDSHRREVVSFFFFSLSVFFPLYQSPPLLFYTFPTLHFLSSQINLVCVFTVITTWCLTLHTLSISLSIQVLITLNPAPIKEHVRFGPPVSGICTSQTLVRTREIVL